jgi:hypothetical protein
VISAVLRAEEKPAFSLLKLQLLMRCGSWSLAMGLRQPATMRASFCMNTVALWLPLASMADAISSSQTRPV